MSVGCREESGGDGISLLLRQHNEIWSLFSALQSAGGEERDTTFRALVRLLAARETAEEIVLYLPFALSTTRRRASLGMRKRRFTRNLTSPNSYCSPGT